MWQHADCNDNWITLPWTCQVEKGGASAAELYRCNTDAVNFLCVEEGEIQRYLNNKFNRKNISINKLRVAGRLFRHDKPTNFLFLTHQCVKNSHPAVSLRAAWVFETSSKSN